VSEPLDVSPVPDYALRARLDGRGIVVLGAGQGIGRQAAHAVRALGAAVVCVDVEPARAAHVAREVGGSSVAGDATDRSFVASLFAEVPPALRALGAKGLDGVVDVIGMAQYRPLEGLDDELWAWHHAVVLRHALLVVQHAPAAMPDGGALVFVSSVSGLTGAPLHAGYGAAKAGLMSLVRSAALELGPKRIRVTSVAPGVVWTPRVSAYLGDEGRRANEANAPIGRVAEPADIAGVLAWLCTESASYVTGQTIVVDGGVSVKFPFPMPDEALRAVDATASAASEAPVLRDRRVEGGALATGVPRAMCSDEPGTSARS
jgi:NAD(P)-dependent dehydrogenase (short-subunit alcohol dehydrogenase family)